MKKFSSSLVIKEMQIETTLRFHLTSVGMAISRSQTTNAGKKETLYSVSGNVN
jgi:hypothetical protein